MSIKWVPIVKSKASVLFQWYVFEGHKEKYFKDSLGINASLENGKILSDEIFIDVVEWEEFESTLSEIIEKDHNFLNRFIELCYKYSDKLIKTSEKLSARVSSKDKGSLNYLKLYQKYQNSVLKLIPFMNATLAIDSILKAKITQKMEQDLNITNQKEQELLLNKLIIPKKKSYFVKENESILELALKKKKDKNIEHDIKKHLNIFAWTSSIAYLGKFQSKEDIKNKIEELLKEDIEKKIKETNRIRNETQSSFKEAYEQIKSSENLVKLVDTAREFIFLQTYRLDVFFFAHYKAYSFLENLAQNLNLSAKELVYLTGEEIITSLKKSKVPSKEEIKKRKKDYALIQVNEEYTILSGEEVPKGKKKASRGKKVSGRIANRGRATAKIKLVFNVEDIEKVKNGDIIVSPMTHPNLVPAIQKASGIITDFGGMLCHAAIISREFGIPCIVGTENATKVFKDGDNVELNAYNGVARKL